MSQQELHKQILDNLSGAVVMINDQMVVEYANPSAEMLLEASMRRLSLLPLEEWFILCGDERDDVGGEGEEDEDDARHGCAQKGDRGTFCSEADYGVS